MRIPERRTFLKGSLVAGGWAALSSGIAGAALSAVAHAGEAERPPTRRFLDAVAEGDLEAVRNWLAQDPGLIHMRNELGQTAFAVAFLARHVEVGALLRERGYRPDLHESALVADWERFEPMAAEAPGLLNQDHPVGGTAMYAAAIGGGGNQVWRVFRYGGDPNVHPRGDRGFSVLRAALEVPDLATAEITAASFLSNGADPNLIEAGGSSALHAAAARGSAELVEMLIRKGARIDARDARGRTPLDLAQQDGRSETARLLRTHGDIPRDCNTSREAYDADGKPYEAPDLSAFSYRERGGVVGSAHRDLDAVRSAVERNPGLAHSTATTTERAVEAGAHMGRKDIVDFLLQRGAPYSIPTAVMRNDIKRVKSLLDEDPLRIHERGAHDFALLWYPVIGRGLLEMAELLMNSGAEVERQHFLGTTALHYACTGGQKEMVALLIERGADVNRVGRKFDGSGQTPLQIAEARGHDDVVRLLKERGARA